MNSNSLSLRDKSRNAPPTSSYSDAAALLISAVVAAATFIAFSPALSNQFVNWDDYETLVDNPHYRGLSWRNLRWMFTTFHMGHYQPLSWLTLGLDYVVWDTNPFGYHLTNLVLHSANAVVFFFLARILLSRAFKLDDDRSSILLDLSAGLAALLFSVHPLRVESVVWATERRDVLSGLFFLLSLYCYVRPPADANETSRRWWVSLSLGAFLFSLGAKASAMTLPLVLLLIDVYPLRRLQPAGGSWLRPESRKILWEKLPFAALAIPFAILAILAQRSAGALRPMQEYFFNYRVGQALYGVIFYPWKSFLPFNLSPLYELPYDFDAWMPLFLFCGAAAAAISVILYALRWRWPGAFAAWIYYLLLLAPVAGIAQSGPQLVADRYSYFSCMSWAVLLGGALYYFRDSLTGPGRHRLIMAAAAAPLGLVLVILGVMSWRQSQVWRDTRSLWNHVIAVAPQSSFAHYNLGRLFESDGRFAEALEGYRLALTKNPLNADAHYNLARLLAKQGKSDEAMSHYRTALKIRPKDADAHNNLGLLLMARGESEAALGEFQQALQVNPKYAKAFFNRGRVFAQQNRLDEAMRSLDQALSLSPDEVEIVVVLADVLTKQGRFADAATHLQRAAALKPEIADVHVALARSLAAQGKREEAEKHYQEALRLLKTKNAAPPPGGATQ